MKLILVGYGQMGRQVESVASDRGHEILCRVDPAGGDAGELSGDLAKTAEGVIEFALPDATVGNVRLYASLGLTAVVGTTGWYAQLDTVRKEVERAGIGLLYGPNFSIGAHLFFRLVSHAARLIDPIPEYDILGFEIHHRRKKDSPSGTAASIAQLILENCRRKSELATEKLDRAIRPEELHVASLRGGEFPGVHTVLLDSQADTIELRHTARNRRGLALGAVMCMEWLRDRRGLFSVDDFINDTLPK